MRWLRLPWDFDVREAQIEGAITRLLAENANPTSYQKCSVVHSHNVLGKFLKAAGMEPQDLTIENSPASKRRTKPVVDLTS